MAENKISQINLRPVQEFTGDRMMQAQRCNRTVRNGIAYGVQQMRTVTHRTFLAAIGLSGLAYDGVRRRLEDSREYLEKAEQRGEEIESEMSARLNERVHQLENQAGDELRKLNLPAVPGRQSVSKPLDWTVRRFSSRPHGNGAEHEPLSGYDELTAQAIIDMVDELDANAVQAVRVYEAEHKGRVTVLRALDTALKARLAVT